MKLLRLLVVTQLNAWPVQQTAKIHNFFVQQGVGKDYLGQQDTYSLGLCCVRSNLVNGLPAVVKNLFRNKRQTKSDFWNLGREFAIPEHKENKLE